MIFTDTPTPLQLLTSSANDGNLSFTYGEHAQVIKNRSTFLANYGYTLADCVVMKTLNHDVILEVGEKDRGSGTQSYDDVPMADALVTADPHVMLFLLTADCLPLTIYDPVHQVVALAHMSRDSTKKHLAKKVVSFLQKRFGSRPADIIAYLGPAIQKHSYILEKAKTELAPEWQPFTTEYTATTMAVDIVGFAIQQLTKEGVLQKNISNSAIDTASSAQYFSHYRSLHRGEAEGRFATIAGLQKQQS